MALNRDALKKRFRDGSRPSASDFEQLIDSGVNSVDDGIAFLNDGIKLSKRSKSTNTGPAYKLEFGDDDINTLEVYHVQNSPSKQDDSSNPVLSIGEDGLSTSKIVVDGLDIRKTIWGTFTQDDVSNPPSGPPRITNPIACNGSWHTILYTRKICQAYEIVAQLDGDGKSMLVAVASTSESTNTVGEKWLGRVKNKVAYLFTKLFGISNNKVRATQSYSDWLTGRIAIKWVENDSSYSLQVKSKSGKIYYAITQLWGDNFIPGNK